MKKIAIFKILSLLPIVTTFCLFSEDAKADPKWESGMETMNMGTSPAFPRIVPAPIQPLENSGATSADIFNDPGIDWAGVEVEAQGTMIPGASIITIKREREFKIDEEKFAHFYHGAFGNATARTNGFIGNEAHFSLDTRAQILGTTATAIAHCNGGDNGIGVLKNNENNFVNAVHGSQLNTGSFNRGKIVDCLFSPGTYKILAEFQGKVTTNITQGDINEGEGTDVDFDFSDSIFGLEGLNSNDSNGMFDNLGIDAILKWKKDPKEIKKSKRVRPTVGKKGGIEATVSFDGTNLSFNGGLIDILDPNGGLTEDVESIFAGDPILNASISVTDLTFLGIEESRFKFSGGTVIIEDLTTGLNLTGNFDNYFIDQTTSRLTQKNNLSSFGILENLSLNYDNIDSPFLDSFVSSLSQFDSLYDYFDFYFLTDRNLVELTNDFTTPVSNVSASLFVGGNGKVIPEPSSILSFLALGILGAASPLKRKLNSSKYTEKKTTKNNK